MESDCQNVSRSESKTGLLSRTAGVRELRKFFSLVSRTISPEEESEDDPLLDLEIFLKQTWNIWGVSLLFDFHCNDEVQLKQYSKKLREEIACILTNEAVSYEAKITVMDARRPKETDHPIVMIEVIAKVEGENVKENNVYRGFLMSWRSETTDSEPDNSTKLPLLLCRGTVNTMRAVHATLSRMFDCVFVSLPVNSEDLMWLLPILISPNGGQNKSKDQDEAQLEYSIPGLPSSESITIKFLIKDLIELWNCFLEERDKIDAEEVEKFYKLLQTQILEISSLQLGLCILYRLQLPSLTISGSKMKVSNVEAMNTVLTYLNEKALDTLHINITQLSLTK